MTQLDHLLQLIAEQQRKIANICPCGFPGTVYADDGRVALCGKCWAAIYLREEASNARH